MGMYSARRPIDGTRVRHRDPKWAKRNGTVRRFPDDEGMRLRGNLFVAWDGLPRVTLFGNIKGLVDGWYPVDMLEELED